LAAPSSKDATQLLVDWTGGNKAALDQLMPVVYKELRSLASRYLRRERPDHTLNSVGLVNEAYLRLIDYSNLRWQDRAQFFGLASQLMRRILIDQPAVIGTPSAEVGRARCPLTKPRPYPRTECPIWLPWTTP
jgi:RNA polymerase sigma factor (TIGR02999 family)